MEKRKQKNNELRRAQIIEAGEKLFLKKGLANTTMKEIADAAELSKAAIYLYFKSKEELYLTIILKALKVLYDMLRISIKKQISPPEKLQIIRETYFKYYKKHPNHFNIITRFVDHRLLAGKPEIKNILNEISKLNSQVWDLITQIINEGSRDGFFNDKIKPIELAIILWTASNGMIQFMDHIKNKKITPEIKAFKSCEPDFNDMLKKTWDIIMSPILIAHYK